MLEEAKQLEESSTESQAVKIPALKSPIGIVAFERNEDFKAQS